ncbi:pseudaminic acid cytidylyltransferase [Roseivivax sp. CAU 1753]
MRLAVIPARGGSKRIPRKNIRPFFGKPMISWSIEAARNSGCFDRIIVSTDDKEIADTAREHGAEVPFIRPAELANDHATTVPVIRHTIDWCRERGPEAKFVCCLYATAPFVQADDLRASLDQLISSDCAYVFSATDYAFPVQRAMRQRADGRVEMLYPEYAQTRSQDLEHIYHDAGQFYWGRAAAWSEQSQLIGPDAEIFRLPRYRVQDIDTPDDWQRAEALFAVLQRK